MVNRIILNETSYHGAGAVKSIVAELAARGLSRPIVFSDPDLVKFGVTKKVTDLLDAAKVKYELFTDIKPNPTIANVKNGVKAAKKAKADSIIAIGGGSSMDTAKAVGIHYHSHCFLSLFHLTLKMNRMIYSYEHHQLYYP